MPVWVGSVILEVCEEPRRLQRWQVGYGSSSGKSELVFLILRSTFAAPRGNRTEEYPILPCSRASEASKIRGRQQIRCL
jgi:hypothetical protein